MYVIERSFAIFGFIIHLMMKFFTWFRSNCFNFNSHSDCQLNCVRSVCWYYWCNHLNEYDWWDSSYFFMNTKQSLFIWFSRINQKSFERIDKRINTFMSFEFCYNCITSVKWIICIKFIDDVNDITQVMCN